MTIERQVSLTSEVFPVYRSTDSIEPVSDDESENELEFNAKKLARLMGDNSLRRCNAIDYFAETEEIEEERSFTKIQLITKRIKKIASNFKRRAKVVFSGNKSKTGKSIEKKPSTVSKMLLKFSFSEVTKRQ